MRKCVKLSNKAEAALLLVRTDNGIARRLRPCNKLCTGAGMMSSVCKFSFVNLRGVLQTLWKQQLMMRTAVLNIRGQDF
jgi:hypothetical protein